MPTADSELTRSVSADIGRDARGRDSAVPTAPRSLGQSSLGQRFGWLEFLCLLAAIILVAAEPVPGVNESHYLPKAKHAIEPEFAGRDLFLQSHDSHGMSALLAGYLAQVMPLAAVAWLGRLLCWCFMAGAWQRLRAALGLSPSAGLMALLSWYFAVRYGNWAGEWSIGGFEGKAIAYACIVLAIAEIYQQRWSRVWLWLGMAVAWHPVAGGWAGLSVGLVWLTRPQLVQRLVTQSVWLGLATAIGLLGVIPAASGLQGANQVGQLVASSVHVYFRLHHHLCPSMFAWERHVAGLISLGLLILASLYSWSTRKSCGDGESETAGAESRFPWLIAIAWCAVLFCIIGLTIDLSLSARRPDIASVWLRFYWFRWADIIVPLAWTLTLWQALNPGLQALLARLANEPSTSRIPRREQQTGTTAAVSLASLLVAALLANRTAELIARKHSVADDLMMTAPANREIDTDRYVEWLAVCAYIREHSPKDSLWFTPEYQQTFKWYAERAEVVCWKDVPQDNASVREWYARVNQCRSPRAADGTRKEWNSKQLLDLARKYEFRWVLVDRRIQEGVLLDFELMYPVTTQNKSFAVFRIPELSVTGQ